MIPFNEYQQWKRTENLALECFNKLYDIGINPESYVQWIYSENFNVNENQIAKYINKSYLFESFGTMAPKPSPPPTPPPIKPKELSLLQNAMKDPARQAMVQRSLQSLKTLQQSYLNSLKRGGLLGKQADLNKLLGDTINAIQSVIPKVQKANESYNYEKPFNKKSLKESYGSNTTYKPKIVNKNTNNPIDSKLLDEWKKTERLLRSNDINVKTFLKNVKNVGDLDEAFGATLDALGSGAAGAIGGLFSGGFKGMVKGAKAGYNSSLDQGERNSIEDAVENLKVLINAMPDKNADLVQRLQKLNKTISPLISGDQMGQAEEPKEPTDPKGKSLGLSKVYGEFKTAFENLSTGKPVDFPSIKDKSMKDKITSILQFSLPLKDGAEAPYQLRNFQIVAHNKSNSYKSYYLYSKGKWYLPPADIKKPYNSTSNPAGAEVTDSVIIGELNRKYPTSQVKYTFKGGKWYLPQPAGSGPMGALTGSPVEVDPDLSAILSKKFPPQGSKNTILDEIGNMIQVIEKGKSGMNLGGMKTLLNNSLQKDPNIKQYPDVINYIVDMFVNAMNKNESVYYTMDYSDFVSDLTNR